MSRPMDVERGAWLAFDACIPKLFQPGLFDGVMPDVLPPDFWRAIQAAAIDQLDECNALKEVLGND